jgi:selenocysteine lyase/cysteine desulfurase
MTLDLNLIRQQFPSLNRPAIFFDNPGGTQIAKQSLDRITKYLIENNANHEGAFATSIASDAVLDEAHRIAPWRIFIMLPRLMRSSLATT